MRSLMVGLLAASVLLLGSWPVAAREPAAVQMEDFTWIELRDAIHAGKSTILVPIGGIEQSGPYLTLGKHSIRVRVLADKIARVLGDALVAPVINYVPEGRISPPTGHMRFPGTITVPDDVFRKTLESAAGSFKLHGFTTIVFLGDHGGYQADIRQAVDRINQAWKGSAAHAIAPEVYYASSSAGFDRILREKGIPQDQIGTHAGLSDTSLQLAVAPGSVRSALLAHAGKPSSKEGIYGGDPRHSTAALGELGVQAIVTQTVAAIRKARSSYVAHPSGPGR